MPPPPSPFSSRRLPARPTLNSSNPFLNSTDNPASRSHRSALSDATNLEGVAASSQPHPLSKATRGVPTVDIDEEQVPTDDLPDRTLDEDYETAPPPRHPNKRLIDLANRSGSNTSTQNPESALEEKKEKEPELDVFGTVDETRTEIGIGDEQVDERMEEDEAVDVSDEQEGTENSEMSSDDESNLMETDLPADPKIVQGMERDSPGAGGEMLEAIPSSELYEKHMQVRTFDERLDVKADIRRVNESVGDLKGQYKIVDRLGEGTFSSVYKAIDLYAFVYDNKFWRDTIHVAHSRNVASYIPHIGLKDGVETENGDHVPKSTNVNKEDLAWTKDGRPVINYVALKRIYVTSSPDRISNELEIMEDLRGCRNTAQLITAFRSEDQVIAVMPFHESDDFRLFYKCIDPPNIRKYFRCLFRALHDTHRRGIIHRDVKPANFLWDFESGEGVLVDFGLAERYEPPSKVQCQHSPATLHQLHGNRIKTNMTSRVEAAVYDTRNKVASGKVGIPQVDNRPGVRANRAGTRGFRAPEVLLKCPDQTVAIDIWAAGIILLSILCHRFPIFNSNDDTEALLELGAVFGKSGLEKAAFLHNRTMATNISTITQQPMKSLSDLVLKMNPNLYTPPSSNPTPVEARRHIESVDSMLDMLKRCLVIDATRRWTAGQLLRHRFLEEELRDDEKEDQGNPVGELREIGEGACGHLHYMKDGHHCAAVEGVIHTLGWGQGRAYGDEPCYLHQYQRPEIWDSDVEDLH